MVVVIIIVRVRLTNLIRSICGTHRLVWIEQAQSARVRHHAQRRERHGRARNHRIEHHAGERVEHARRNGNTNAVVAKGESKILRDIAHGGMGQIKRMHQTHQRAIHQCHVRGLNRHIRASSNGESYIRTGKRRSIVDTVAHHRHRIALRLQFCDFVRLVLRSHSSDHVADANLICHGMCRRFVVSGEHHHVDAMRFQSCDGLLRIGFHRVGNGHDSRKLAVNRSKHRRFPLCRQPFHSLDNDIEILVADARHGHVKIVDQIGIANSDTM